MHEPAPSSAWTQVSHTQRGTAHEQSDRPNEDALACRVSDEGVVSIAVADGVGSGERGDLASALVAHHWADTPAPPHAMEALDAVSAALGGCESALAHGLAAAGLADGASGSMLVGAWLFPSGEVLLGHVGDCRAYRLHGGELLQLTRDHTYGNLGLNPPYWGKPDDPARMIGASMMGPPDVQRVHLVPGDWLLLCSDGLHGALSHERLTLACQALLEPWGASRAELLQADGSAAARSLAQLAVREGGRDDVSVALARFEGCGVQEGRHEGTTVLQEDVSDSVWPSDVLRSTAS